MLRLMSSPSRTTQLKVTVWVLAGAAQQPQVNLGQILRIMCLFVACRPMFDMETGVATGWGALTLTHWVS